MTGGFSERIYVAVAQLREAGVNDAVIAFEALDDNGEVQPFVIRVGSPMACLALAEFASDYLESRRNAAIYTEEVEDDDE